MNHSDRIYLTHMPIRIWHWINAFSIVILCLTGIQIRFPEQVKIFGTFKATIWLHNTAGITLGVIYLLWAIYYGLWTRTLFRLYFPTVSDLTDGLKKQSVYYFYTYFKGDPNPHVETPENKFNPVTKLFYVIAMFVMSPLIIVTGILLLNAGPLRDWIIAVGGIKILIGIHYLVGSALIAFMLLHIYLTTLGTTFFEHYYPMWHGWEKGHTGEQHGTNGFNPIIR